mmetsp:Transcript_8354/g.17026  ORF Transcript_8354/g.17026 Transcript_8354/m.17026 type:complete len:88 (-) Transcript_8354:813-1076(-)
MVLPRNSTEGTITSGGYLVDIKWDNPGIYSNREKENEAEKATEMMLVNLSEKNPDHYVDAILFFCRIPAVALYVPLAPEESESKAIN